MTVLWLTLGWQRCWSILPYYSLPCADFLRLVSHPFHMDFYHSKRQRDRNETPMIQTRPVLLSSLVLLSIFFAFFQYFFCGLRLVHRERNNLLALAIYNHLSSSSRRFHSIECHSFATENSKLYSVHSLSIAILFLRH